MIQPQIVLLKAGTDTSQGTPQLISNINSCNAVAEILRTTLGPMGMDKLIKKNDKVHISNDGATLISLLDIVHPAAKVLTEIAQAQDDEVGDGTTSVVLFASELLKNSKSFVEDGVAPQVVISGFRRAAAEALKKLDDIKIKLEALAKDNSDEKDNEAARLVMLEKIAKTSLSSKLIDGDKDFFAKLLVKAILQHPPSDRDGAEFFQIKPVSGGSINETKLVEGVAFKKTFSYAGFEQQPKQFDDPKVALINVELELKSEHLSGEVRVNPSQYKAIVDAEWKMLYDKLDLIVDSGAQVVLSQLPIGDLATQYFAEKKMFCAGRVAEKDMRRMASLTGGAIQTSLKGLADKGAAGNCARFEEQQVGKERFNIFLGEKNGENKKKLVTLILRGGSEQYVDEASRSINDALMALKNTSRCQYVVPGGGAVEIELSRYLKKVSRRSADKSSLMLAAFAESLEVIPRCLALNAGLDATEVLNKLRCAHHNGQTRAGVSVDEKTNISSEDATVWEPFALKENVIKSATEAACLILSVDETIRVPKNTSGQAPGAPPARGAMPQMGGMMR